MVRFSCYSNKYFCCSFQVVYRCSSGPTHKIIRTKKNKREEVEQSKQNTQPTEYLSQRKKEIITTWKISETNKNRLQRNYIVISIEKFRCSPFIAIKSRFQLEANFYQKKTAIKIYKIVEQVLTFNHK